MEASVDSNDEKLIEARRLAEEYSASVRSLLMRHGAGLSSEVIENLISHAYEDRYEQAMGEGLPEAGAETSQECEVVELNPNHDPETANDEQAEAIALEALLAIRDRVREQRLAREELLELDYERSESFPEYEVVRRNGVAIFPAEPAEKPEKEADQAEQRETVKVYLGNSRLTTSERFILDHLKDVDPDKFTSKNLRELGYGANKGELAAKQSFMPDMLMVGGLLQILTGREVLVREGNRGGTYYHLLANVEIIDNKAEFKTPAYSEELPEPAGNEETEAEAEEPGTEPAAENEEEDAEEGGEIPGPDEDGSVTINLGEESDTTHRLHPDIPRVQKRTPTPKTRIPESKVAGRFDDERVKDLEEVLASLVPRDKNEVLKNHDLKLAVAKIMDDAKISDYRTKVVLVVRYGLYPTSFRKIAPSIRRGDQNVRLATLLDSVDGNKPLINNGQGLDLASASELLAMDEVAILQTEHAFLEANKGQSTAMAQMMDIIAKQLEKKKKELEDLKA